MRLAEFKDLCIDATNPAELGGFWAAALGLELHHQESGNAYLTGTTEAHTVWINQVPEPKTTKHRIHLDIHGSSVASLQTLGATLIDADSFRWVVMTDPEGGEFCLFLTDEPPEYRLYELVVDCRDHATLSLWWANVLDAPRTLDPRGFSFLSDIANAPFSAISFLPVPEAKQAKNRLHIDLLADDVQPILDAGATLVRVQDDEIQWSVLADPEGNEFCVFATT